MEAKSFFKSVCARCEGHIEAPAEAAGMWIRCPHCGEKTQLIAPPPKVEPATEPVHSAGESPKRMAWLLIVVVAIGLLLVAGAVFVMSQARHRTQALVPSPVVQQTPKPAAVEPNPQPEPDLWNGLKAGPITIEKSAKSRLVYAVGTVRNDSDKQRYGVKVSLDVMGSNGEKVGTTTDYTQFIDAHKEWTFKALVTSTNAASAKVSSITEE